MTGTAAIVDALKRMVRRFAPRTLESIAWGSLSYHRPEVGGRVKGAVCQITVKDDEVRLEFIHGIRLTDPAGILRGNRLSKRFVTIASVSEAESPAIAQLIQEAAELEFDDSHD